MYDLRLKLMVAAFVGLMACASLAGTVASVINPKPQAYDGSGRSLTFQALPDVADVPEMNARYVGGYKITATGTSLFEGLSDVLILPTETGVEFEAVSDFGHAVRFGFSDGQAGPVKIEPLKGPDSQPFGNKVLADAEGLARDDVTGDYYVSFEGDHRVMRYPAQTGLFGLGKRLPLKGLPSLPNNEGMEALAFHRDGDGKAYLIIGAESGGFWRCGLEDNQCVALKADAGPGFGYAIVSLRGFDARRPDEFLALYRFYAPVIGVRVRLRRVRLTGDRLEKIADVLAIAPPMPNDNYESIATVKTSNGYRLFLISDPLSFDHKTRLLMFDWVPKD